MARKYSIQLMDRVTGKAITASGGVCMVVADGLATEVSLQDANGAAASNPSSLTNGHIEFYTADTVQTVDLYVQCPGGQFAVAKDVTPGGYPELWVDTNQRHQTMVIPFAVEDQAGDATETDSGFTVPTGALLLPGGVGINVIEIDATETIDVGTMGTSNDPDGLIDGLSVATLGPIKATNVNGSVTLGALLYVQDSVNAGDDFPEANDTAEADNDPISWTLSAGADTAQGFIFLPYLLAAA